MVVFNPHHRTSSLEKDATPAKPLSRKFWQLTGLGTEIEQDVAVYEDVLNLTPDDIDYFGDSKRMVQTGLRLQLKILWSTYGNQGIFKIVTPTFTAFQFGKPDVDELVSLKIFSEFAVDPITVNFDAGVNALTQDQINCVLATLKPRQD